MNPSNPPNNDSLPQLYEERLASALRRALQPLVGFLLHRGVTYPVLSTLIRRLYVEQAQKEFQTNGKPMPDSQLSLLTGIARRYVKEIRQDLISDNQADIKASPGAKLIAEWLTDPHYLDAEGQPLAIPRSSTAKNSVSFEALTRRVNRDAWHGAVLQSLADMQLVKTDANDQVHLLANAYLPSSESLESLGYFADHLHDHIAALSHNLLENPSPLIERSAYETQLSPESVETVREFADSKASELLRDVYKIAAKQQRADKGADSATHRVRIGVYFYTEDTQKPEEDNDDKD